ncbi:hypothetical protein [Phyllobacterium sp. P5_D12]
MKNVLDDNGGSTSVLRIELDQIYWGSVVLQITVGNEVITTSFSDFDDQLSNLVKFINEIDEGGFPSAKITDYGVTTWSIEQVDNPEICRFTIDTRGMPGFSCQPNRLSALIDRTALLRQLVDLSQAIGEHYNLAHGYLFFASFENSVMEPFLQQSEDDWEAGVAEGRFEDDLDKQDEYQARRMVAELSLDAEMQAIDEQCRRMMRTGVVPETMLAII